MPGAPFEIFLKVDGIDGESTVEGHEKEMLVLSYEQSIGNDAPSPVGGGGGGAGRARFSGVKFRKDVDTGSIALMLACASGLHIRNARFAFRRVGESIEFYKVLLEDAAITHIAQRAGVGDQYPLSFDTLTEGPDAQGLLDEVTMHYAKIRWEYQPVDGSGAPSGPPIKGGWDVKANKKI